MFKYILHLLSLVIFLLYAQTPFADSLLLMDGKALDKLEKKVKSNKFDPAQREIYSKLINAANQYLARPNPTVINKTILPPSKDKHDYLSISRYWWPDPTKKDGLPWIRKDGITNPDTQTDALDRPRIGRMVNGVKTLALSYKLSGNTDYAEKAASMIRTWFIDEKTRMNPNLKFAQSIPGNPNMRRSGILDGRLIPEHVLDSITLISDTAFWTQKDDMAMRSWLNAYLKWLTESDIGKDGAKQMHNHGSWYRFQIAALAMYLGNKPLLENTIATTKTSLNEQFDEAGAQPLEITRTRSFFYSNFNIRALNSIGIIAEKAGMPFWDYETQDKRSIKLGIDYITPTITGKTDWPHPNNGINKVYFAVAVMDAKNKYRDRQYNKLFYDILAAQPVSEISTNILNTILLRRPEYILGHAEF